MGGWNLVDLLSLAEVHEFGLGIDVGSATGSLDDGVKEPSLLDLLE
jgi:hypothetical protein